MKKAVVVITTVSVFLFIIAIFNLTIGIFLDKKNGPENATARYETLLLSTRQTASKYKYGTPEFAKGFINAIGDISDFAKLELEINNALVYSYPPEAMAMPSADFAKSFSDTCTLQNGSKIKLRASIYMMKPVAIYNHARVSFLLILVGTLITILLLIYTNVTKSRKIEEESLFDENFSEETVSLQEAAPAENTEEVKTVQVENIAPVAEEETTSETEISEDTVTDEETEESSDIEETESENTFAPTENIIDEPAANLTEDELSAINEIISDEKEYAEVEDHGEFVDSKEIAVSEEVKEETSEEITFLSQSLLEDNLENELQASNEANQDISIAIIRIDGLPREDAVSKKVAEALKEQFSQNAIIHEYKDDGFAVIMKNLILDSAVAIAEPLHSQLSGIVSENDLNLVVTFGISSKANRDIQASRLIKEADQAEAHAKEDPDSPIVAFRVNPEKYKQLMNQQATLNQ